MKITGIHYRKYNTLIEPAMPTNQSGTEMLRELFAGQWPMGCEVSTAGIVVPYIVTEMKGGNPLYPHFHFPRTDSGARVEYWKRNLFDKRESWAVAITGTFPMNIPNFKLCDSEIDAFVVALRFHVKIAKG